jgi:4-alpha-glucanotransferase
LNEFPRSAVSCYTDIVAGAIRRRRPGAEAYRFADFLGGGQSIWQMLPLGPTGYGDSPYMLLGLRRQHPPNQPRATRQRGSADNPRPRWYSPAAGAQVDFEQVNKLKTDLLQRAYERYRRTTDTGLRSAFETFCERFKSWLDDYACFRALKTKTAVAHGVNGASLVQRSPAALARARGRSPKRSRPKILSISVFQTMVGTEGHCNERAIRLVGDIPKRLLIRPMWTNDQFKLNRMGDRGCRCAA